MSKAKRLNEMIMLVNRKKRFNVGELAQEFGVSKRTILRDLQELSEMGVPLYSEVGPHGGYQVLRERILPPIAFSEEEAKAIFFMIRALRHYASLPFNIEYESIQKKFYFNLSGDMRDAIDRLEDRVEFMSVFQQEEIPFLRQLLDAAIEQNVIAISYEARGKSSSRSIQPIGIYASQGNWYCPAYCFAAQDYRVFRCDRIQSVKMDETTQPVDLSPINLKNRYLLLDGNKEVLELQVELTGKGVEKFRAVSWANIELAERGDGTGVLKGSIARQDVPFFSDYFISYSKEAIIKEPPELIEAIKEKLSETLSLYHL